MLEAQELAVLVQAAATGAALVLERVRQAQELRERAQRVALLAAVLRRLGTDTPMRPT